MKNRVVKKNCYPANIIFTLISLSIPSASLANSQPSTLDISLPTIISSKTFLISEPNPIESSQFISFPKSSGNILTDIQDRYLTIYYGKAEKIKAVYAYGGYGIAYQQEW